MILGKWCVSQDSTHPTSLCVVGMLIAPDCPASVHGDILKLMRIPSDAIIPIEKLTRYLLVPRPWDDKSQFLAQAGFSITDPAALDSAIRRAASVFDALEDGSNEYGTFFRVEGELEGPKGRSLPIVLIWLQWNIDGTYHFVTLKPLR